MLVRGDEVEDYVAKVAELIERYGIALSPGPASDIELIEDDDGALSFELVGELPGLAGSGATVEVREELSPSGDEMYRTTRFEYELIDREAAFRRAFHLHDSDWFARRYLVLVHAHCERPLGTVDCDHYAGSSVRDSFEGVSKLIEAWMAGPIDCMTLACLE